MEDLYFKDESTKILFALVELPGKIQMDLLGIGRIHYINSDVSKKQYTETKEKIANSNHPKLDEAMEVLEKIYKGMKQEDIMLHCTILKKYWNNKELQGLNFNRVLKIIEILEIWEGENV